MPDDEQHHAAERDSAWEVAVLREALLRQQEALQAERRRAQRWEREAVLRSATVAGALTGPVLAAQRLAAAVERNLTRLTGDARMPAAEEVRDALEFFREVVKDSSDLSDRPAQAR